MTPSLKQLINKDLVGFLSVKEGQAVHFVGSGNFGTKRNYPYTLIGNGSDRGRSKVKLKGPEDKIVEIDPNADAFFEMRLPRGNKER